MVKSYARTLAKTGALSLFTSSRTFVYGYVFSAEVLFEVVVNVLRKITNELNIAPYFSQKGAYVHDL